MVFHPCIFQDEAIKEPLCKVISVSPRLTCEKRNWEISTIGESYHQACIFTGQRAGLMIASGRTGGAYQDTLKVGASIGEVEVKR